jgi:hypothetical protein
MSKKKVKTHRSESIRKLMDEINTPEYKEKVKKRHHEFYENLTMDYLLGVYVGEYIVENYLPTLSIDYVTSRKCIKVSEDETNENKRLSEDWFNSIDHTKSEDKGDPEKWKLYIESRKKIKEKYLPKILNCWLGILKYNDEEKFKTGLINSLWNSDICHYSLNPKKIQIIHNIDDAETNIILEYGDD